MKAIGKAVHEVSIDSRYVLRLEVDDDGRDWLKDKFPSFYPNEQPKDYPEFRMSWGKDGSLWNVRLNLQARDAFLVCTTFGLTQTLEIKGTQDAIEAIKRS